MTLEAATLLCSTCGRLTDVSEGLLLNIQERHKLPDALTTVAGLLPLLASLRCSVSQAKGPVLRASVDGAIYPFTAADLDRSCLSCGEALSPLRVSACPWTTICVGCLEESEAAPPPPEPILAICKRCGRPMALRCTKHVAPIQFFLGCSRFPRCTYTQAMPDPD